MIRKRDFNVSLCCCSSQLYSLYRITRIRIKDSIRRRASSCAAAAFFLQYAPAKENKESFPGGGGRSAHYTLLLYSKLHTRVQPISAFSSYVSHLRRTQRRVRFLSTICMTVTGSGRGSSRCTLRFEQQQQQK